MSETVQFSAVPRWDAVAWVVEHNTRDLIDGRFSLASEVASWFKSLILFREAETERLIMNDATPEDLQWHKAIGAALLADGERLWLEWQAEPAGTENSDRIKRSDLRASVDGLYDNQLMWHNDMTAEQRKEILKAVFKIDPDELTFAPTLPATAAH